MGNIRDIKTRIDSVRSTKQITNAMKMVAASKLRKAQERIVSARPYANYINSILTQIKLKNKVSEHPILSDAKYQPSINPNDVLEGKELLLVVTSDKGLCGSFNYHIIKHAIAIMSEKPNCDVIFIGKKGFDFFKKKLNSIAGEYLNLFNEMDFTVSAVIGNKIFESFIKNEYSKVSVLYNEFKSAIQQNIVTRQILPIELIEMENVSKVDYIYEPDEETILEELASKYVNVEVWRILLESSAAEQGARMTAMDNATENALK